MKTLTLILLLLPGYVAAHSPSTAGIPWDKALHFSAGYIGADITETWAARWPEPERLPWWGRKLLGLGVAAMLATGKEAADPRWDWADWGATMLGGGVSITVNW